MSKKVVTTSFGLVLALSLAACDDRGTNQTPDPTAPTPVEMMSRSSTSTRQTVVRVSKRWPRTAPLSGFREP